MTSVIALAVFIAALFVATLLLGGGALLWIMFFTVSVAIVCAYLAARRRA
jgi:hypothetical protein